MSTLGSTCSKSITVSRPLHVLGHPRTLLPPVVLYLVTESTFNIKAGAPKTPPSNRQFVPYTSDTADPTGHLTISGKVLYIIPKGPCTIKRIQLRKDGRLEPQNYTPTSFVAPNGSSTRNRQSHFWFYGDNSSLSTSKELFLHPKR